MDGILHSFDFPFDLKQRVGLRCTAKFHRQYHSDHYFFLSLNHQGSLNRRYHLVQSALVFAILRSFSYVSRQMSITFLVKRLKIVLKSAAPIENNTIRREDLSFLTFLILRLRMFY